MRSAAICGCSMPPTCNFVPIGPRSASVEGGVVHLNLPRPREGNRLGALENGTLAGMKTLAEGDRLL